MITVGALSVSKTEWSDGCWEERALKVEVASLKLIDG